MKLDKLDFKKLSASKIASAWNKYARGKKREDFLIVHWIVKLGE